MFDKESGLGEGGKPVLVKAVVAESAIEAFNKSVLHGLSRLDVMKGDARRSSPEVKSFAGQLRAIVQRDDLWQGTDERSSWSTLTTVAPPMEVSTWIARH